MKLEETKFDELMENLSNREWQSSEGLVALEDMPQAHIERVVSMIEEGNIKLMGLEEEYVEMFNEELEDRAEGLNFDEE